jgi:hypothetical protein
VLPTGPGKTETLLATQVYRRLDRSLVPVPSDTLRRQIAMKPEKPRDRRDVNRSRDAFGGDCSDCGCRHGGYAASGAGIAGSDCIHDAGELRFWSVGWMYQDHFLQADSFGTNPLVNGRVSDSKANYRFAFVFAMPSFVGYWSA